MSRIVLIVFSAAVFGLAAHAQHNGAHSPYAGFERRQVKALSEQQIADLRAGRGMGLALAAELNGYPGPLHVLELADKLALTAAQREKMQELFEAMRRETIPIGEQVIAQEAELDRLFSERTITPGSLAAATDAIGGTQAALRRAHLKYHLATVEILSAEQVRRYGELRGYGLSPPAHGHGMPQHR